MKKADRKKLLKYLDKWTRNDIIARLCPFEWVHFGDAVWERKRAEKKIRQLLYGTSDLVEIGHMMKLPVDRKKRKKK